MLSAEAEEILSKVDASTFGKSLTMCVCGGGEREEAVSKLL